MKTKSQKQYEAIERKRRFFHVHQKYWVSRHAEALKISPTSTSLQDKHVLYIAQQAEIKLLKAAKEAHLDRDGNPIKGEFHYDL
jgi:hypothetical protein